MRSVQNGLTDEQFEEELIKRFFHPKSYFYCCIKQEIDALVKSPDRSNSREYELFDEVVEKIVSSEDKEHDLGILETIEGFGQLRQRLEDGIRSLRHTQQDRDGMKIEIENLAQSLIKVGVQALFDEKTKIKIQAFLNSQIIPELDNAQTEGPQASHDEPGDFSTDFGSDIGSESQVDEKFDFTGALEEPEQVSDDDQFDEIPLELIEDLHSSPTESNLEDPVEEPIEAPLPDHSQPTAEESLSAVEPTDLEEDFLLLVGGEEPSSRNEEALAPQEQASALKQESEPVQRTSTESPVIGTSQPPSGDGVGAGFIDGFGLEIKSELAQLQKSLTRLREKPGNRKHWASCDSAFDKISAKAMVGGFEGFEEVSIKARKFITRCLRSTASLDLSSIETLSDTYQAFLTLLQDDIDHVDRKIIAKISQKLEKPKRKKKPRKSEPQASAPQPTQRASVVTEIPTMPESQPAEPVLQVDAPPAQAEQDDFDISKFKLPGEDDDEIISLVHEISKGEQKLDSEDTETAVPEIFDLGIAEALDFEEPNPTQESQVASVEQPHAAQESTLETESAIDPEFLPSTAVDADDKLAVFKEQSEFYLDIVRDSFQKLQANPGDKIALEDLELSSHSLYEMSLKLGLEAISPFPAAIERTVKSLVASNSSISSSQLKDLREAYEYFAQLNSLQQATSSKASSLIAAVDNLTETTRPDEAQVRSSVDMDDDSFQII
ncbi:hypothetical protein MJD09_08605 [bacterium]|nr:hypothetical protein [bacterium]